MRVDLELLERFYASRSPVLRRLNAAFFRVTLRRFLLAPGAASAGVVRLLVRELPELRPLEARLLRELRELGTSGEYVAMMYSRETTPHTFALFDRFPELGSMQRVLTTYRPAVRGAS